MATRTLPSLKILCPVFGADFSFSALCKAVAEKISADTAFFYAVFRESSKGNVWLDVTNTVPEDPDYNRCTFGTAII